MDIHEMPLLRPVPIPTLEKKGIKKIWFWGKSKRIWKVEEDWIYEIEKDGTTIIIEKGFEFDGASVPRLLWWIFAPVGLLFVPSIIHDYGYTNGFLIIMKDDTKKLFGSDYIREDWDRMFLEVAHRVNGKTLIHNLAWLAVRLGGWLAWSSKQSLRTESLEDYSLNASDGGSNESQGDLP